MSEPAKAEGPIELVRLNFSVPRELRDRLHHCRENGGGGTYNEVLNRAITQYEQALRLQNMGGGVSLLHEQTDGKTARYFLKRRTRTE